MATRLEVYAALDSERDYQEMRRQRDGSTTIGGDGSVHDHSPEEFLLYMKSYLDEAITVAARTWGPDCKPAIMEIVRKVTALGVANIEANGAPQRDGFYRPALKPSDFIDTKELDDEIPF